MGPFLRLFSLFLVLLAPALVSASESDSSSASANPKLIVLLAIDQMRPDRLSKDLPGGLGRLMREGYVFENGMLDHGITTTCGGHVAIGTGTNPGNAGIPGNSYVDHKTMESRYCVDDPGSDNIVFGTDETRSPNAIRVDTLGDWLKTHSPDSKVVSISAKDRAAITMAGKQADTVVWFHRDTVQFTTSSYYGDLPPYVIEFNQGDLMNEGAGKRVPETWTHPEGSVRIDDYPGESQQYERVSGHPVNTGDQRGHQLYMSAYMDELTGELARTAIQRESLGTRGVTDLLAVSYSATDTVGHAYGPYSAESEDLLRRLDKEIGLLLDQLDQRLGGDYIVALSADHGVLPLPEWLVETKTTKCPVPETRITFGMLGIGAYTRVYMEHTLPFGNPADLIGFASTGVVVNADYAKELGITVQEVVGTLETYFEDEPWVKEAWTQDEIFSRDDPFSRLYRNSFVDGKSPHLTLQLHETCLLFRDEGTSHGSPYDYDRHVPLIFFGKDIRQHQDATEAHSIDIAPTFAERLGLTLPDHLDGKPLSIWKQPTPK